MTKLTHFDEKGRTHMVDVSLKTETERIAVAKGTIYAQRETILQINQCEFAKGDVLEVARLAGIMSVKRTPDIIPLCHAIPITGVILHLSTHLDQSCVEIESNVKSVGRTGVEMEALTAVSVAALTIYDMCKGVDRTLRISDVRLIKKTGGKSGDFQAE